MEDQQLYTQMNVGWVSAQRVTQHDYELGLEGELQD